VPAHRAVPRSKGADPTFPDASATNCRAGTNARVTAVRRRSARARRVEPIVGSAGRQSSPGAGWSKKKTPPSGRG